MLAFLLAALALLAPPAAHADGDPASDILVTEGVYFGFGIDLESREAAQLAALVELAGDSGYELKVALIPNFLDLGVSTWMWLDPREYAKYLSEMLSEVYGGRVLVLMRNGYGFQFGDLVPGRERRALSRLKRPARTTLFVRRGIEAVLAVAAANDIKLKVPDVEPVPGGIVQPEAVHDGIVGPPIVGTPTPTPTPTAAAAAEEDRAPTWPYLVPIGVFAVAALGASRFRRSRERASLKTD